MKIRCIAVDDEPQSLKKLCNYIDRIPYLELVKGCEDAFEARAALEEHSVDAIFIDINMPDFNGLEFISSLDSPPLTVFITAYSEYAVDSYAVEAVDYVLKPYGFADLQRAAERLLKRCRLLSQEAYNNRKNGDSIFVKVDYRWVRINTDDLMYIRGYSDYLQLYLSSSRTPLVTKANFSSIMKSLPQHFIQAHRSFVVNTGKIKEIDRSGIILCDTTSIPLGNTYKQAFMDYIERHGIRKTERSNQ